VSLPAEQVKTAIERAIPGVSLHVEGSLVWVAPGDLTRVCQFLKGAPELQLDYVADLTAIDYPSENRMDVVYHLYSMARKQGPVTLKVKLDRTNPTVASVTPIWRGAEYQEREAYDLYGVKFDGHPDLRRILMWEGFKGHPMRKDYVVEDQDAPEESVA